MIRSIVSLLAIAILLSACLPGSDGPGLLPPGDPAAAAGWTAVEPPADAAGAPSELYTAGDGVLVRIGDGYYRSDGGQAWRKLTLPAQIVRVVPAPDSLERLYAISRESIAKSVDGGRSWSAWVAPGQAAPGIGSHSIGAFAPSAADPNLVYFTMYERTGSTFYQVWRTRNDGASWEKLYEGSPFASLCGWSTFVVAPHPTDSRRVFWSDGCIAGRNVGGLPLSHSTRQGSDWGSPTPAAEPESRRALKIFAEWLEGGFAPAPNRWYQAGNNRTMASLAQIARSDDDGVHWQILLEFLNGPTAAAFTYLRGFEVDPRNPDRLYVVIETTARAAGATAEFRLRVSDDGGLNWRDLAGETQGAVKKIALSGDGGVLYLLTDLGLYRR